MSQPRPAGTSGSDPRANRPLGRGLENVSHVFLSQQAEEGNVDPRAPSAGRPLPPAEAGASPLLLRPATRVSREQLAGVLREFLGALEEGLRWIDTAIPCAPCGEIDLLAIDRASQLTVVDFDLTSGDDLLLRGLGHLDWLVSNVPNLRRMFRGHPINFSLPPRLFLLAPQFSPQVQYAARRISGPRIAWIRYHLVEAPERTGILFEPVAGG